MHAILVVVSLSIALGCNQKADCPPTAMPEKVLPPQPPAPMASKYHDNANRDDVLSGGTRMIPIKTPAGTFNVWTKRTGNNPTIKVLLLHGGPGVPHEYMEAF